MAAGYFQIINTLASLEIPSGLRKQNTPSSKGKDNRQEETAPGNSQAILGKLSLLYSQTPINLNTPALSPEAKIHHCLLTNKSFMHFNLAEGKK